MVATFSRLPCGFFFVDLKFNTSQPRGLHQNRTKGIKRHMKCATLELRLVFTETASNENIEKLLKQVVTDAHLDGKLCNHDCAPLVWEYNTHIEKADFTASAAFMVKDTA